MTNVYIAAKYSAKKEVEDFASYVNRLGAVKVVSTWHKSTVPEKDLSDPTEAFGFQTDPVGSKKYAIKDLEEIDRSDVLVFYAEDANNQPPKGGRHVEFGYALAMKKTIIVIGERENVFHTMVTVVPDRASALVAIANIASGYAHESV